MILTVRSSESLIRAGLICKNKNENMLEITCQLQIAYMRNFLY